MITLEKMTDEEFTVFNEINIAELTRVFALKMPLAEAREKAEKEQEQALPEGVNTEGHFIFSIRDDRQKDAAAGGLWFSILNRTGIDIGFIFFLWVDPLFRGRRIGTGAMKNAEEHFRNLGVSVIRLHVLKNNKPAMKVYKRLGYQLFTDYDRYDENDPGIIMEKKIVL